MGKQSRAARQSPFQDALGAEPSDLADVEREGEGGGDVDVLVVGAGPTGLTAACEAIRHGLTVRIVDRKPYRSTFSKALVAHARTPEVFETMGVVDAILAQGTRFAALNTHAGRRRRSVRVDLLGLPWGDTAYPFWLSIPQYATERVIEARLNELGAEVQWQVSLDGIQAPARSPITIDAEFLDELIRLRSGIEFGSHDVVWESQFNLSHGLVDHYRRGRVFLAGNAAHVHSPVGGQGLNTGVQDAHNLLWKLAMAQRLNPVASNELLDSYEAERRPVARAMVRGTARATGLLTARNGVARALLGAIAPRIIARPAVQARLGRPVGMLDVAYRHSPQVVARPAAANAGRRMPNPKLRTGERLYQRLDDAGYTWVVRGRPREAPPDPGEPRWSGVPVAFLTDDDLAEPPWLRLDDAERVILVRPDRYIAAVGETTDFVAATVGKTGGGRKGPQLPG